MMTSKVLRSGDAQGQKIWPNAAPRMTQSIGRPILFLSLAAIFGAGLNGCDSQSATFSMIDAPAQDVVATEAETPKTDVAVSAPAVKSARSVDSATESGGQSLLEAAKIDDSSPKQTAKAETLSENTLHATLIGDFEGMIPCSFCEGITVTLNLFSDGSVIKTSVFEAPEMPKAPLSEAGVYRQDNNNIIIAYDDKSLESFEIQDNHLVMLGKDKKPNADYILARQ